MAGKAAVHIAVAPDHALQRFQPGGFAILIHKAQQDSGERLRIGFRLARFAAHRVERSADLRLLMLRADKCGKMLARVRKKDIVHEANIAGGAFYIGNDGADHWASSRRRWRSHSNKNSRPSR